MIISFQVSVWKTKYRNKVLKGHVEEVLKQSLYDMASKYGFTIAHMEIGKDTISTY